WRRGSRDPCLEPRGIAGTSPGENRPARHRVAEARVPGVAALENGAIAAWRACPRLPKRTPSGRTASATAWWGNAHLKMAIDNQASFGLTVPLAGTPAKSGTLLLLSRSSTALLPRASNSSAAAASSLARFAFLV